MNARRSKFLALIAMMLAATSLVVISCGKAVSDGGTDSSTHWLQRCDSDDDCGALQCLCNVCSRPCGDVSVCPDSELSACALLERADCEFAEPACVASCSSSADCESIRAGLVCSRQRCQTPEPAPGGGASGGSGGSDGLGGNAGSAGAASACDDVAQCEFACPEGTVNPVDDAGCEHTCECAAPGTPPDSLRLFYTCGDPVCMGHTPREGVPLCSSESVGDVCRVEGASCDPTDDCNRSIICASTDPTMGPGGCPISRRSYKTDIHYLQPDELARFQSEVLSMKLATWRYKHDASKERLGFIIDDEEGSVAVDGKRDMVDLYGYTSLAIAALQLQSREIAALKQELAELKRTHMAPPVAERPEDVQCAPASPAPRPRVASP
jgi:hypothetical protein